MIPPAGEDPGAAEDGRSGRPAHEPSDAETPGFAAEPLKESAEDDVLPVSPRSRRLATVIALLIAAAILVFLVVFIATHTEQADGGSMFGTLPAPGHALKGVA